VVILLLLLFLVSDVVSVGYTNAIYIAVELIYAGKATYVLLLVFDFFWNSSRPSK